MKTSLEATDQISAAVQKTSHRVSLDQIKRKIASTQFFRLGDVLKEAAPAGCHPEVTTVCVIFMTNGFTFIGTSTPADPANYDEEVGQVHARDDAIRKIWPMEGYLLRETLAILDGQVEAGG